MSDRIHIQHVLLSLRPGGLENGVVNVVNRLDPARFRSSICCLQSAGEFAQRVTQCDCAIHEMGRRGGLDWRLLRDLVRLFRRTAPDIVHTRNAEAFFYGTVAARLAGVPHVIHSEHGRTFDDRALRLRAQRWLTPLADTVFAVSAQLKGDLVERVGIAADRIEVLYNGVDLKRFDQGSRGDARTQLGLAADAFVVGSVARLVPVKNYPLLLQALAMPGLERARLVLIGDGPERARLESLAAELGLTDRVLFTGHREDVGRLLPALDVFVLPSLSEGMSNTLLEAMACGVLPVVSRVGGNPEIVLDGEQGWVFESGHAEQLARHLRRALEDEAQRGRMAAAARKRVVEGFAIEAMVKRYEDLYARIARRGG